MDIKSLIIYNKKLIRIKRNFNLIQYDKKYKNSFYYLYFLYTLYIYNY